MHAPRDCVLHTHNAVMQRRYAWQGLSVWGRRPSGVIEADFDGTTHCCFIQTHYVKELYLEQTQTQTLTKRHGGVGCACASQGSNLACTL